MFENHERRKYPIMLKFDCRKMRKYEIAKFMEELLPYGEVQGIGGVIVYVKGKLPISSTVKFGQFRISTT